MPSADILSAFFATALLMALVPGPDNLFVLTQSAVYGARAGFATTFGLITGLCAHTAAVTLGVAALFALRRRPFSDSKSWARSICCILPGFPSAAGRQARLWSGAAFPAFLPCTAGA